MVRFVYLVMLDVGVDYSLKHPSDAAVLHVQLLINEGALVTACGDDMVHLWNFRQKVPEIVHSIQLNKEQVTCINLPFQSKWLHVGTERGNVYFVSVATFTLSTYVINWNKAIDLSCRTHPGAVKSILTCPIDASKILILFDKGIVVLWNLSTKEVERFSSECPARSLAWHHDGRQFICGNADGSLVIWNAKKPGECVHKLMPHGQKCRPITQVDWRYSADGEQMVIFSGGVPQDEGVLPALTIMRASRSATVLEMDHPMIAFIPLVSSPYSNVPQHPFAVAVLLKNDLLVIDLNAPGYPCFENLNPMDIHESPLTFLKYFSNCPIDLIGALTLVGCKQRRQGFSDKPWPITGGTGRECATGHQELLLSGHEDGSLKFWQASGEHLQILYKLKTGRHFERSGGSEGRDVSHAVVGVELCLESRLLLVAGQSAQVTLFRFVKNESANEIAVVNVPNLGGFSHVMSTEEETTSCNWGTVRELRRQGKAISQDSHSTDTSEGSSTDQFIPLKVRGGALRRPAGYQPELVCLIPWKSASQPEQISSMALNSAYGILAIGTASGLALVDIVQYTLIYSWSSCELYGSEATPSVLVHQNSETVFNDFPDTRVVNSPSTTKSFIRLSTESRQKSGERRPILSKAQSVVDSSFPQSNGSDPGRDQTSQNSARNDGREPPSPRKDSPSPDSSEKMLLPEAVTSLCFIHSCFKKHDVRSGPCLWLGTSTGACIAFSLLLPSDRLNSTVVVAPTGSIFRLKGQFLYTAFLDQSFCLLSAASESFRDIKDENKATCSNNGAERSIMNKVVTKGSLSPSFSNASECSKEDEFSQIVIMVSEEEVKLISLPNFNQLFSHRPDIPFVMARATHVRGHPVLMLLNGAGQIVVLSLPTLRPLICSPLFRQSVDLDDPMCQKTSFSEHGLGIYAATPSEVQKFTVCSELAGQVRDCMGDLFVPVDMPEPPRSSFLKGVSTLFSQKESIDLDSIFVDKNSNTTSGSGMRSIAKTIPGPSASLEQATSRGVSAGQAANLALQALHERSEKLGATVDATERLKDNAMTLSQRTGKLVEKYEKKKWYNF
uniref:Syntaxin-binding protein 5-like protein n=1 Tax=Ascaris suum TaxID=6253 RepID=F1KQ48_ASCSU